MYFLTLYPVLTQLKNLSLFFPLFFILRSSDNSSFISKAPSDIQMHTEVDSILRLLGFDE